MAIYGYARCSTQKQDPQRQYRNILSYSEKMNMGQKVHFFFDSFTGTKMEGRKDWNRLMKAIKPGDTIIFDAVSRMSRNAEEGVECYRKLYNDGINLKFIKEPHIDTDVYRTALNTQVPLTGTDADAILEGVNKYLLLVAEKQIRLAFEQSEAEVMRLRQRTSEGIITAKANGKTIGRKAGSKYETKKAVQCKKMIQQLSRDFDGQLMDKDLIVLLGVTRHTYYKYKAQLKHPEGSEQSESPDPISEEVL